MIRRLTVTRLARLLPVAATAVVAAVTIAPWLLGFSASHAAVAGHIAFAMGVAPLAVLVIALPPAAVTTAIAGGWLIGSPWALGYASAGPAAWGADVAAGLALIALGRLALRVRGPALAAAPPSGARQP